MEYVCYKHFDKNVMVREDLKGKHRNFCLCWNCTKFNPDDRKGNCSVANHVYSLCVLEDLVLPVWECPIFEPIFAEWSEEKWKEYRKKLNRD